MKRFLSIFNRNKLVAENYFFMTAMQVANMGIALLLYPYLIRTLGVSTYGIYVFAVSVTSYFIDIVNFGYYYPAMKQTSDTGNSSLVYSAVLFSKIALFILGLLFLFLLSFLSDIVSGNSLLISIIVFSAVLGDVIAPNWIFQVKQKMKILTMIQVGVRVVSIPIIFFFVKSSDDLLTYVYIASLVPLSIGIFGFIYLFLVEKIRIVYSPFSLIKSLFKDSLPIFYGSFITTIRDKTAMIIVGVALGYTEIAIFDLANKIILLLRTIIENINKVLFVKVLTTNTKELLNKILKIEYSIGIAIVVFITLFAKYIVLVLGGAEMLEAYPITMILSVTILSFLVVEGYSNLVFIPAKKMYFITYSRIVSTVAVLVPMYVLSQFNTSVFVFSIIISVAAVLELLFCIYMSKRYNLT